MIIRTGEEKAVSQKIFTDKDTIERFIIAYQKQKITNETTMRAVINNAIQHEKHLNKYLYQFTKDEILEMYRDVHSLSVRSLQNRNMVLKDFTFYIIEFMQLPITNTFEKITREDLSKCIDQSKKEKCIISRAQLTDIQSNLFNDTDKGILEALFLGFGGNKLKELTFFNLQQISKNDNTAILETGKMISMTDEQCNMIVKACRETSLRSFGITCRSIDVVSHGFFKERSNAKTSSSDPENEADLTRRYRFIQRRLMLISEEFDLPITSGKIQDSGLLYYLQNEISRSGEPFDSFIKTETAKKLAQRYDIYTEFYSQILKEKFGEYFDL